MNKTSLLTTAADEYAVLADNTQLLLAILGRVLVVLVCIGLVGNVGLYLSVRFLIRSSSMAKSGGHLLMLESFFDGAMCLLCIIYVLFLDPSAPLPQPSNEAGSSNTMTYAAASFLCYVWYTELIYWIFESLSVCNLIMLTIDRYIAVIYPMKHRSFVSSLPRTLAIFYAINSLFASATALGCDLYVYRVPLADLAASESANYTTIYVCGVTNEEHQAIYRWIQILWGLLYYLLPVAIMVFCYSCMIFSLIRSNKKLASASVAGDAKAAKKSVKSRAAKQMVKTVVVLGVVFSLSLAQDDLTTTLSGLGVYSYVVNTPIQQMGVLFIALNYTVAPYTVFMFMPSTRRPVVLLIRHIFKCEAD